MNIELYYPVLFVSDNTGSVKKFVNSNAPYRSAAEALDHSYHADYPGAEPGYAYWNGSKWVSETFDMYEEGMMEDPDFRTRQDLRHQEADYRLDCEARGIY